MFKTRPARLLLLACLLSSSAVALPKAGDSPLDSLNKVEPISRFDGSGGTNVEGEHFHSPQDIHGPVSGLQPGLRNYNGPLTTLNTGYDSPGLHLLDLDKQDKTSVAAESSPYTELSIKHRALTKSLIPRSSLLTKRQQTCTPGQTTSTAGVLYDVTCDVTNAGTTISTTTQASLGACFDACVTTGSTCVGVTYTPSSSTSGSCVQRSTVGASSTLVGTFVALRSAVQQESEICQKPGTTTPTRGGFYKVKTWNEIVFFKIVCDATTNDAALVTKQPVGTVQTVEKCMEYCAGVEACGGVRYDEDATGVEGDVQCVLTVKTTTPSNYMFDLGLVSAKVIQRIPLYPEPEKPNYPDNKYYPPLLDRPLGGYSAGDGVYGNGYDNGYWDLLYDTDWSWKYPDGKYSDKGNYGGNGYQRVPAEGSPTIATDAQTDLPSAPTVRQARQVLS